jgi:hypothetical protein
VVSEIGGANVSPVPVSRNPAISVGWDIPDYGARRTNDAPPFTVTGTANPDCASLYAGSFLVWTPSEPGGTVLAQMIPTEAMSEAFDGAQTIHVVANRAHVRAAPAGPLLAHAKAHSTGTTRPVTLHIVPTAAGHALLSAPHPALQARYTLKFRPRGSKRTISKSKIVTIPART